MSVKRQPRGFTLIEIFMTVSVIGIAAALALPSISAMVEKRAASIEVDKVRVAIVEARDDARARLRCIKVTRPTTTSLKIDELTPVGTTCGTVVARTVTKTFKASAVSIPNAIDLTFNRSGAVTATGQTTDITIMGKRGSISEPHVLRIFHVIGIVRRLS